MTFPDIILETYFRYSSIMSGNIVVGLEVCLIVI